MEIKLINNDILIKPETQFEEEFISQFDVGAVFVKSGLSPAHILGIKLTRNLTQELSGHGNKCGCQHISECQCHYKDKHGICHKAAAHS